MNVVDSVSSSINYGITNTTQAIYKIARNPYNVSRVLQIATKLFEAADLLKGRQVQERVITNVMKGTNEIIGFYRLFENILFWVNPFSKETLDQELLLKELKSSLSDLPRNKKNDHVQKKTLAEQVFEEVMDDKQVYYGKGDVRKAIKASLKKKDYTQKTQDIANQILIQQKSRPILQVLSTACFTFTSLVRSTRTLQKWGFASLSQVAAQVGGQSRVFLFAAQIGIETTLGIISIAGLLLSLSRASYRAITNELKHYHAKSSTEKAEAYKELREALLDVAISGMGLLATATPLLFTVNPLVGVGLAILSGGTGLVCTLAR